LLKKELKSFDALIGLLEEFIAFQKTLITMTNEDDTHATKTIDSLQGLIDSLRGKS
jgi:uncharacterized coiled-coil protein SlyX